jgi:hypothetical protein
MSLRKYVILIGIIYLSTVRSASAAVLSLDVEPIIGYQKAQQVLPTQKSTTRTMYGVRVIAGILLISAESEYTRGTKEENVPDFAQTHTLENLKAGLRSGFRLGSLLTFSARGGVQASRGQLDQTSGGVTTTTFETIRYNPYAGASARARLTKHFSASADVVAVIPDIKDLNQNEYQITAGFAVRFP